MLVAYDDRGRVVDFGSLEVQAVYISGNIRRPFEFYMEDPDRRFNMDWSKHKHYPRPDYLSSSRKRLAPQLIYKGGILNAWGKKMAVALHKGFYQTLPHLPQVAPEEANLAWFIYDLEHDPTQNVFRLVRSQTVYTEFKPALDKLTTPEPGPIDDFIEYLQGKLDERLESNPPDAPALTDILEV